MGIRLIIGGSGSGKSYMLYSSVIKRSMEEENTAFLVIVPDQFTMQTQKKLVDMHPRGGIMNIDVLSFSRLAHRIFEEVGGDDKPVLDDTGKSLVLRKIAGGLADRLPVIGSNLKKIGYVHEMKSVLSEFMQYGIGVEEMEGLVNYCEKRGALHSKLADLDILYRAFMAYIEEKYVTAEETLDLLKQVLAKSKLVKDSVIAFDGFTGFTPIQYQVIGELLRLSREVIVTIVMDGRENPYRLDGEQKLFHLSKKTVASLIKLAQESGAARMEDWIIKDRPYKRFRENESLAHLEENLFRYPMAVYTGEQESISIFAASNPQEEIRQAGRKIRRLLREGDYYYRDIAVIAGDLETYASHVEEQFEKFGIPCYIDRTRGIELNPFIEYIKSALQAVNRNFTYEPMFRYLRSGLTDIPGEDVDKLENYCLALGIRGRSGWENLFTRRYRGLKDAQELEHLNQVREKIMDGFVPLLQKSVTVEERVRALYDFLVQGRTAQKLAEYEAQFTGQGDLVRAKEFAQIYPLVMGLLDQLVGLLGNEKMSGEEFSDVLEAGFNEMEVGTIPQNVDRVLVGDMERSRLGEVKILFFVGMVDGNIPKNNRKGGMISDIDREFLAESKWELAPSPRQQMFIQRLYLYMNMTQPSDKLILSYSKANGEGKAARPAYLIDLVQKMYPGIVTDYPETDEPQEQLESAEDGFTCLADMFRDYAKGFLTENREELFYQLFGYFLGRDFYAARAEKLKEAAFYQYGGGALEKAVAGMLYGNVLENSVSRLEKFSACAYAHFLQYGLTLEEREEYSFEDVDMGNVFHGVLERFSLDLEASGLSWFDFNKEEGEALVSRALDSYAAEYGETVLFSNARNEYALIRMKRILNRTVETLQYQLKKGSFQPSRFEVSFSSLQDLESVNVALSAEERMRLTGRIDRVDTLETQDKLYVKILDYKSGNKSFDLVSFYNGLQLQLVVYLNAAMGLEQKNRPDKEVVPAAVLYYHMADPYIQAQAGEIREEELNQAIRRELRMTGLVNDTDEIIQSLDHTMADKSDVIPVERKKDGSLSKASSVLAAEDFQNLCTFVNHKIREIGSRILDGEITVSPYEQGQNSACTYCDYQKVCGFDSRVEGYEKRSIDKMEQDEVLLRIREEAGNGN